MFSAPALPLTSEIELFLLVAESQVGVTENPPGSNRGEKIKQYLAATGLGSGLPWCMAFLSWTGDFALGARWPLPLVAGCVSAYEDADARDMVHALPNRGALFLQWVPRMGRFAHAGVCLSPVRGGAWVTIEGNTSGRGNRDGWGCFKRRRAFKPADRFVWWWAGTAL